MCANKVIKEEESERENGEIEVFDSILAPYSLLPAPAIELN